MHFARNSALTLAGLCLLTTTAYSQVAGSWVALAPRTATRLVAAPSLVVNTNMETNFAWGDFNHDGYVDIAVARKFPGSQTGGFACMLLMNEGGVLVDRTSQYAYQSDQAGYNGFFDLTNTRRIAAVDVDGDGWLDLVTSTTMSDGVIDILGQPRVYHNLGNDAQGNWLGFRHERNRIPHIYPKVGVSNPSANPRFCWVGTGDLNGDGFPDLYFTDYDTAETAGQTTCIDLNGDGDTTDPGECQTSPNENSTNDFDNKLLFNYGNTGPGPGFFYDTTTTILTAAQLASQFGVNSTIADLTGDGKNDIATVSTLTDSPNRVSVYTKQAAGSTFLGPKNVDGSSPYFVEAGDLNGDGKLDLVVVTDGQDKYYINNGNDVQGQPNFTAFTITASPSEFGKVIRIADMDKDGHPDVFITDVDTDLGSFCPTTGRRTHFWRNMYTGGSLTNILQEPTFPIPTTSLAAWFDCAPVDLDNDGWPDLVVGRCAGIEVYMNRQAGIDYSYPSGKPPYLAAGATTPVNVNMSILGTGTLSGTPQLKYRVNGGSWSSTPASGAGLSYTVTLPALSCGDVLDWYVSATLTNGGPYNEPPEAPGLFNTVTAGSASINVLSTSFETGNEGWTVVDTGFTPPKKGFEVATPNATTVNGKPCAPGTAADGSKAMVTYNGPVGGAADTYDLDGGTTVLTSPVFDLSGVKMPQIRYSRWYYCNDNGNPLKEDPLYVDISNDGGSSWHNIETVHWMANAWTGKVINVTDYVTPTSNMLLRFTISDVPDNSITEAGVDNVVISGVQCVSAPPCPADLDGDHVVGGADLGMLLAHWGQPGITDLNNDGITDGADLGTLLAAWGACP